MPGPEIPAEPFPAPFFCPITGEVMKDPVVDPEGNSYERAAIEEWLKRERTSPLTRSPLTEEQLAPNRALRDAIEEATAAHGAPAPRESAKLPDFSKSDCLKYSTPGTAEARVFRVGGSKFLSVSVAPPTIVRKRAPLDICCSIDVSGSMCSECSIKTAAGVESDGLSTLDVVKHAVSTIIALLEPEDRLSLVEFSSSASVRLPLTFMTEGGKHQARRLLAGMTPSGATNLWDGMRVGMDLLAAATQPGARTSNAALLLLTDGCPTVNPPRGHEEMFQRYIRQHDNALPAPLHCFGFGYDLDTQLLGRLARMGAGMFGFIPDAGFVGTVFINALANVLAEVAASCTLHIKSEAGCLGLFGQPGEVTGGGKACEVPLGSLRAAHPRHCVVALAPDTDASTLEISMTYKGYDGKHYTSCTAEEPTEEAAVSIPDAEEYFRLRAVELLCDLADSNPKGGRSLEEKASMVAALVAEIKASAALPESLKLASLLLDLEGQVSEALSKPSWFGKWGKHFLPSLARAHQLEICNNFKDPGVQHYGGPLFIEFRDIGDDIFDKLPPPKPSRHRSGNGSSHRAISMRNYNSCNNPCFHGLCVVDMADGTRKRVDQLKKGDHVRVPRTEEANDVIPASSAAILCVVRTACGPSTDLAVFPGGLAITPYHPVWVGDTWVFPLQLAAVRALPCEYVYSLVLDAGHKVSINGVTCITLAHDQRTGVAQHPYFASPEIVRDLAGMQGWRAGLITFSPHCLERSARTGLLCAFDARKEVLVG